MKPSFAYRAAAKLQTILFRFLTRAKLGNVVDTADIHLQFLTEKQQLLLSRLKSGSAKPTLITRRVLLVVPFRDKWDMTLRCVEGLLNQKTPGLQILLVLADNGSQEAETADGIVKLLKRARDNFQIRHCRYDRPFNFSWINNQAVKDAKDFNPEILGFINNDIEFVADSDIAQLVTQTCTLPEAGAVGCTLIYPNQKIQHLFIFVGSKIVGSHPFKGVQLNTNCKWFEKPQPVSAVTGAVMFMRESLFQEVGGFDEDLPSSYQDVDLCLKLAEKGFYSWTVPYVVMVHHETQTRSREPSWGEAEYMYKKWGPTLTRNPLVSPLWSRKSEHFVLSPSAFFRIFTSVRSPKSLP